MDIGEQERVIIVEPLEDPFEAPPDGDPALEPVPDHDPALEPEPAKEPAGVHR